jgi:hypothetical protein
MPLQGQIDLAASHLGLMTLLTALELRHVQGTATSQVTISNQPTATVSGGTFCTTGNNNT